MTDCKLSFSRGSIYLVGAQVNFIATKWKSLFKDAIPKVFFENRAKRDGEEFHMTVVSKARLAELTQVTGKSKEALIEEVFEAGKGVNLASFVDIGVGKASDCEGNVAFFVIISFEKLRIALKSFLDVSSPLFHITLAFNPADVHCASKNLDSLLVSPLNKNLLPGKDFIEEVKLMMKNSRFSEALKAIECVKATQKNAEILDIKALLLFKLSCYEESLEIVAEIKGIPGIPDKSKLLAMIREADCMLALRRFRAALLPIWGAFSLLNCLSSEQKSSVQSHLIGSLKKCARHGYLRIDVLPVSRKKLQEIEKDQSVIIADLFILEAFELYKQLDKREYEMILDLVSVEYGELESEVAYDEEFMPLESRWVCCSGVDGKLHVLQRNFSYLWPNRLAVSSTPRHAEDIDAMTELGIVLVITLTEEEPLKPEWFKGKCVNLFLPVPNYNPPSVSVADRIVWEIARLKEGRALIHCGGGKGRAGTAAACVLMTLGMDPNSVRLCDYCLEQFRPFGTCPDEECHFSKAPLLDPNACLNIIRMHRPESLETVQQEAFLKTYSSALWQRSTVSKVKESFVREELEEETLEVFGAFPAKMPRLIILSGLPGSGKTTFAKKLVSKLTSMSCGYEVDHINQDAIGGRDAFENALGPAGKAMSRNGKYVLIVDRCNARKRDRKDVLDLLHNPEKDQVILVHFATAEELCLQRIEQRFDHLTLKPEEGRRAVRHFSEIFERPDQISKNVATLLVVRSIADSEKAIEMLSSCVKQVDSGSGKASKMEKFYKFPRTEHLFNLGGATRDDLVLSPSEFKTFFAQAPGKVITMEEKIDGANLGFSMDENGKILCQNRSHYVDSKYHFQFQSLGSFIFQKRESLERVLQGGRILYGEWMFAKHSIHYTALPDLFIAFDIFDTKEQKFLDRASFREIMSTTNIAFVQPLVENVEAYSTRESMEKLLTSTKSKFSDSLIEGIYFRWDQNGRLKTRSKLVRSDFISGDEHWSKGKITLNTLASL